MNKRNVLIIGAGGREHALAWKIAQSSHLGQLFIAPGNAGTASIGTNVSIKPTDIEKLVAFARDNAINLTIVGPDDILALGIVDAFAAAGLRAFGPTRAAAQIEASKAFSKRLMQQAGISTASYATFTDITAAKSYAATHDYPLVIKASGLALGKGVSICQKPADAMEALDAAMDAKVFGEAGATVIIEDYLSGAEVSLHAFCDGKTAVMFPSSQDHKAIGEGDEGPNTGGMGTIAPVSWAGPELINQAHTKVVEPVLRALAEADTPFTGLLYPGLMVDAVGMSVLEFNARFGDPETQSYMRLLESDLLEIIEACLNQTLSKEHVRWSSQTAVTVILASEGYPGNYHKGRPITGLDAAAALPGVVVFHAGTIQEDDEILTSGGRVLGVSAIGESLEEARARAYAAVDVIHFDGMQYRRDIGNRPAPR